MKKLILLFCITLLFSCVEQKKEEIKKFESYKYIITVLDYLAGNHIFYANDLWYMHSYCHFKEYNTGDKIVIINAPMIIREIKGE